MDLASSINSLTSICSIASSMESLSASITEDMFPEHKIGPDFGDILDDLYKEKNSEKVIEYWRTLEEEGTMANIINISKENKILENKSLENKMIDFKRDESLENKIYKFAEFMEYDHFVEFKKLLGIHGHIIEFVRAISTKNMGVITYFVIIAKAPRHYSPMILRWFYNILNPLLDKKQKIQLLDNCTNAVYRWISTQRRNKKTYVPRNLRLMEFNGIEIPVGVLPRSSTASGLTTPCCPSDDHVYLSARSSKNSLNCSDDNLSDWIILTKEVRIQD